MALYDYLKSNISMSVSSAKEILGSGEINVETGHVDHGCFTRLGFAELTRGSLRRVDDFPPAARRALVLSRISGEYGWAGTLGHELLEQSFYHEIDVGKGRNVNGSLLDCNTRMWEKFDREWDRSLRFDAQTYLHAMQAKISGDPFPVWLKGHAKRKLEASPINFDENSTGFLRSDHQERQRFKDWLRPSADYILHHLNDMIEHTPYNKWYMIEGKKLSEGDIITDGNQTQEQMRNKRIQPSFDLEVDGIKIRVFCTLDFAYLVNDGLRIADLKTGKAKESYSYQLGLYGFCVTQMFPGEFDPEQISFRLMYPAIDKEEKYVTEKFDSAKLEEVRRTTEDKIRKILGAFSSVGERETATVAALQSLVDTYPVKDAVAIWCLAHYNSKGQWPKKIPQIRQPYPLEIHRDYEAKYFSPEVPSKADVMLFMTTRFSPQELGQGFKHKFPDIDAKIEAIVKAKEGKEPIENLSVNLTLRERICESMTAEDFIDQYDPSHLRVILTHKTPANGAEEIPEHCPGCKFYNICDPGKMAFEKFEEEKAKK